MKVRSALSWVIGETQTGREARRGDAQAAASALVQRMATNPAFRVLPLGQPIDMSPATWRGVDLPDGVLYRLPASKDVRGGSVHIVESAGVSRVEAAIDVVDLDGPRIVLLVVSPGSAAADLLMPTDVTSTYRSELVVSAHPSAVEVYLVALSRSASEGEERG